MRGTCSILYSILACRTFRTLFCAISVAVHAVGAPRTNLGRVVKVGGAQARALSRAPRWTRLAWAASTITVRACELLVRAFRAHCARHVARARPRSMIAPHAAGFLAVVKGALLARRTFAKIAEVSTRGRRYRKIACRASFSALVGVSRQCRVLRAILAAFPRVPIERVLLPCWSAVSRA